MIDQLMKWLTNREHELDRRRTRCLARQQWSDVIEVEARIDELRTVRALIVEKLQQNANKPTPSATVNQTPDSRA